VGEEETVISPQGMAHSRHQRLWGANLLYLMAIVAQIYTRHAICRVDELSERGW